VGNDTGRVSEANLFQLPAGIDPQRIHERRGLMEQFDRLRADLDRNGSMEALDAYRRQAVEMVIGQRAQQAFDLSREPAATRERYGKHLWCQQALLARRLVEAGAAFVTLDLSYHTASGTWDTHGDNIPPYGGIRKGLGPLLPLFDHLITTLIADLEQRGLLDQTLVVAMGEFGRTPQMGTQGSTDGRNHWPYVMSMLVAGGGLRHGQVIGSSEKDGGQIKDRPVTLERLQSYRWPGNVRELVNLCRRLTALAPGSEIQLQDLPAEMHIVTPAAQTDWAAALTLWAKAQPYDGTVAWLDQALPEFERVLIRVALNRTHGHRQEAARVLGWGRNTLTRKLKELGMSDDETLP